MIKPVQKSGVSSANEAFAPVLAAALKKSDFKFKSPEIQEWIAQFVDQVRSCLEDIYCNYGIPPDHIFNLAALCKFAPVPQEFPKRLRNGRQRERTAILLEKATEVVTELDSIDLYGVRLFSDPAVDLVLKGAATRIRALKSIVGRPESRIMKDFAIIATHLLNVFDCPAPRAYEYVATLLKAVYPERWLPHGESGDEHTDAVKKLIQNESVNTVFKPGMRYRDFLSQLEKRDIVRKFDKKITAIDINPSDYEKYLAAFAKWATNPNYRKVTAHNDPKPERAAKKGRSKKW